MIAYTWTVKKKLIILIFVILSGIFVTACDAPESAPDPNKETRVPDSSDTVDATKSPEGESTSEKHEVSWSEALDILNNGDVKLVSQSHNLEVSLVLNNGRTVTTVEPRADAIFEAIAECGEVCSNIILVTE